jgi:hypothetical protein
MVGRRHFSILLKPHLFNHKNRPNHWFTKTIGSTKLRKSTQNTTQNNAKARIKTLNFGENAVETAKFKH